jgi:multidrug efflux pump subunit AcrA (membrane-fusion protein)
MKRITLLLLLLTPALAEDEAARRAATVVLDEAGVKHLQIEKVEAEEITFTETVFALGEIKVAPGRRAVVSSRVPGRVVSVEAHIDTAIAKDAVALVLESRLPGDPPPLIKLTAPLGGLVSAVNVVPGQPVEPNDSLVEIIDLTAVHATAAVPDYLVAKLEIGQSARIRVPAYPGDEFAATLAHLGAEADRASGTLEAAFHVDNPGTLLRPGMRAEFHIATGEREGVMAIPRSALLGDPGARYVFIADYELKNAFVKTPVITGAQNDKFIEIKQGLLPGDEVVTHGAYALSFAGKGTISLKEALDAAHGHPHNEDGTEMTAEQIAAAQRGDHTHNHAQLVTPVTLLLAGTTLLFFVLFILAILTRKRPQIC